LIIAGGAGSNEIKIFDRNDEERQVVCLYDISREIYCVDFSNQGGWFTACGADGYSRNYFMSALC